MSHASAVVRFGDGHVMHAEYNGTVDVSEPQLFDTYQAMWASWRRQEPRACTCGASEQVEYWTSYAGGMMYQALACRRCRWVGGLSEDYEFRDDPPLWAHE